MSNENKRSDGKMKCDLTFESAFILQGNTMLLNVNKEEEKNYW